LEKKHITAHKKKITAHKKKLDFLRFFFLCYAQKKKFFFCQRRQQMFGEDEDEECTASIFDMSQAHPQFPASQQPDVTSYFKSDCFAQPVSFLPTPVQTIQQTPQIPSMPLPQIPQMQQLPPVPPMQVPSLPQMQQMPTMQQMQQMQQMQMPQMMMPYYPPYMGANNFSSNFTNQMKRSDPLTQILETPRKNKHRKPEPSASPPENAKIMRLVTKLLQHNNNGQQDNSSSKQHETQAVKKMQDEIDRLRWVLDNVLVCNTQSSNGSLLHRSEQNKIIF
jgi:hypothetical protein